MSTAATPLTPAVPVIKTGNKFDFSDHSGKTKVTYYPIAPGPPIVGHIPGPSLAYSGPEGNLNFSGSQINQQDTPMGTLLSVVLKPPSDLPSTTFSLFLPPVAMGNGKSETFTTYAVKTHKGGFVLPKGALLTYEVERLSGNAEIAALPD